MQNREEIYQKALELFIERGYDNTPMSHIAEAVDLSKAGLYHYFASKKHLLFLIHEHYLEKNLIPLIKTAEKIPDPEERLSYIMRSYAKLITKDATARELNHEFRRLEPEHFQKVKRIWGRAFRLARDTIKELEEFGKSKRLNATFAAFTAFGMVSWSFYWFDYSRKESIPELLDTFTEIFFRGLLKDSSKV